MATDTLTMTPLLGHRVQIDARKGQHRRTRRYGVIVDVTPGRGYTVLADQPEGCPNARRMISIVGPERLSLLDRRASLSARATALVSARQEMTAAPELDHYRFVI